MPKVFQSLIIAVVAVTAMPAAASDDGQSSAAPAISGYDPVAYFTEGKPVRGQGNIVAVHDGTLYLFAKAEHRDIFTANPDRYVPQYGGHCAHGVSQGVKVPGDPMSFAIVDDKLYFTVSPDLLDAWKMDVDEKIQMADRNWFDVQYMPLTELN